MVDHFDNKVTGLESPAVNAYEITPDDDNDLDVVLRAFYVGGDGDVKLETVKGDVVTLVGLIAGTYHPIRVKKIYDTDTTATDIVGFC